jgi:hypothetical protein
MRQLFHDDALANQFIDTCLKELKTKQMTGVRGVLFVFVSCGGGEGDQYRPFCERLCFFFDLGGEGLTGRRRGGRDEFQVQFPESMLNQKTCLHVSYLLFCLAIACRVDEF